MGAGIALVAARAGHPVRLLDVRPEAAGLAVAEIVGRLQARAALGRITAEQARGTAERLTAVSGSRDLAGCAVVVEAVAEDLAVKQRLFTDLEQVVDDSALLATNTSSLSVTAVGSGL